jgi:putative glutathione S-transferase
MGLLVDGVWHDEWYDTKSTDGKFVRKDSIFRNTIEKGETDRYHLYVSLACPWAHRTLIFRKLKKLENIISVSVVNYHMAENGWEFTNEYPDHLYHKEFLHQIYTMADPKYTGRVTVPILWDKQEKTIVNNESSDIIRIFNSAFNELTGDMQDFYPEHLRSEIDQVNAKVYDGINNGVYKCGFATTQIAYEEAFENLFNSLDWLEDYLNDKRYLMGDTLTEADWRLFTTLIRFDVVYVGHFKCNKKRILDYPNIHRLLKHLYEIPGISETVDFRHIKHHYYGSHKTINPTGIVPLGPEEW